MAGRRIANVFSLSFLDIMSCGFGAVILIFIIMDHSANRQAEAAHAELITEVREAEEEVQSRVRRLGRLQTRLRELERESAGAEQQAERTQLTAESLRARLQLLNERVSREDEDVDALQRRLAQLESEAKQLKAKIQTESEGDRARAFVGEGDRQYLTGLRAGGTHILVLLDASASMLDETLVNILRRRLLPPEARREAPKWQRAVRVVEWIFANLPAESHVQVLLFNKEARLLNEETGGAWMKTSEREELDAAIERLRLVVPEAGTNLHDAFAALAGMEPRPDNVFLLTDSLPTRDAQEPKGGVIEARDRVKLFDAALAQLPKGVPVNIILFPMEGDPFAAPLMWQLAQLTGGSFMSPASDWP